MQWRITTILDALKKALALKNNQAIKFLNDFEVIEEHFAYVTDFSFISQYLPSTNKDYNAWDNRQHKFSNACDWTINLPMNCALHIQSVKFSADSYFYNVDWTDIKDWHVCFILNDDHELSAKIATKPTIPAIIKQLTTKNYKNLSYFLDILEQNKCFDKFELYKNNDVYFLKWYCDNWMRYHKDLSLTLSIGLNKDQQKTLWCAINFPPFINKTHVFELDEQTFNIILQKILSFNHDLVGFNINLVNTPILGKTNTNIQQLLDDNLLLAYYDFDNTAKATNWTITNNKLAYSTDNSEAEWIINVDDQKRSFYKLKFFTLPVDWKPKDSASTRLKNFFIESMNQYKHAPFEFIEEDDLYYNGDDRFTLPPHFNIYDMNPSSHDESIAIPVYDSEVAIIKKHFQEKMTCFLTQNNVKHFKGLVNDLLHDSFSNESFYNDLSEYVLKNYERALI